MRQTKDKLDLQLESNATSAMEQNILANLLAKEKD